MTDECVNYWDSREWKEMLFSAEHPTNRLWLMQLRQKVFFHTIECVTQRRYITESGLEVNLPLNENIFEQTHLYKKELKPIEPFQYFDTQVEVINTDCLITARNMVDTYGSDVVTVLNMCNRHVPGSSVLKGRNGQEEYLFRCSDYFRSLWQFSDFESIYNIPRSEYSYPLRTNYGGIFSRGVLVFRDTENTGYKLLDKPYKVNFIAVPAISHPKQVEHDGELRLEERYVPSVKNKIRTIFRIALRHGQEVLVLSAWGCGGYGNPPRQIASLFKEVIEEEEFVCAFRKIVFSIKGGPNMGNYIPFRTVICGD